MLSTELPARAMPPTFEAVYRAEFKAVWRLITRLGVQPALVEDLVHDVFLTAHKKWSDYDSARPARAWLFGIAYRLAADHRALKRHQTEVSDDDAAAQVAAPVASSSDFRDARKVLDVALGQMSDEARAVFVMNVLEDRPVPEVAELMGTPVPTAYTRLRSARQTFANVVSLHTGASYE
jgi:RNA polymerase sigma factor (sigma-70 family)